MKILVISGFLGAGKTTFIKQLVKKIKGKVAIMENEFGALDVDSTILRKDSDVFDFSNGCICCNMKSDFTMSVLTIANSIEVDYLIIEPTGVGLLGNVLNSLKKIEYERIKILSPITIVDAQNFDSEINEYRELMENQIKFAGKIILSKIEKLSPNEIQRIKTKIREINSYADITTEHYSTQEDTWWDSLTINLNNKFDNSESFKVVDLETKTYRNLFFNNSSDFSSVVSAIMDNRFGKVSRVKGYVKVGEDTVKIDIVENNVEILKTADDAEIGIVIIGKNIEKDNLDLLLNYYQLEENIYS